MSSALSASEEKTFQENESTLSETQIRAGLGVLGKHPITLKHTYLELKVVNAGVKDISALSKYPCLMYVNLSNNKLEDAKILNDIPALMQLDLSHNSLTRCLDFNPVCCNKEHAWSQGDTAIGSMLTKANLSHNNIFKLDSLAHHPFLEVLIISNNSIECIEGLSTLKFLKVLDVSNNRITDITGLDYLELNELNLRQNRITLLSGLEKCLKLSSLDVSSNSIRSLLPLKDCANLMWLDARDNQIEYARQAEFLSELTWLNTVLLMGNPCSRKHMYRRRVIHRLRNLFKLDESAVTAEEKIETANMFGTELSDADGRMNVFYKHLPHDSFENPIIFQDEELSLTEAQLQGV